MVPILVIIISAILSFFNSIGFFTGLLREPSGTVYLGTIHYFEDYFLYLNHFFQGAHGQWLVANRYTSEITAPSILYWSNLLLGKIGGLVGLSPIFSYNGSVILLSFFVLLTSYTLLKKIFPSDRLRAFAGFFLSATATSMMNYIHVGGKPMWYPFQLWRTPHFAFDRLGGAPHQLMQTLVFLLLSILYFRKDSPKIKITAILVILGAFLSTINPIQAIIFVAAAWGTTLLSPSIRKTHALALLMLSTATLLTVLYTNSMLSTLPHLQSKLWESWQHTLSTLPFLLMSIGPVSLFFLLGLLFSLRQKNPMLLFGIILVLGTYTLFLSPIPKLLGISNLRVIFPALYPFMGAIAVNGVFFIAKKVTAIIIVVLLFVLTSLPTIYWEIEQKILNQADRADQTIYLPKTIHAMFTTLITTGRFDDVVLANPKTRMDAMVPALSGHTTYSGHMLATTRSGEKQDRASRFFAFNLSDAENFIKSNNIRYILFTSLDGDVARFVRMYPFLKIYTSFGASGAIFTL